MADVTIEARPNGPYIITGTVELRDTNGNVLTTQARTVLCRCGASTKKPFCDGTHSKIGVNRQGIGPPIGIQSGPRLAHRGKPEWDSISTAVLEAPALVAGFDD